MQQILEDEQAGKFSPEVKICTAYVKTRLRESTDGKTVLFKTGGKVTFLFIFNLNCLPSRSQPPHPPPPPHTAPPSQLALKPSSTNWTHCTSYIFFKPPGVVHVPVAQKPSDQVTPRTRLNRTKALKTVGNKISCDRFDVHMIQTLKWKSQEERRQILHDALGKELVLNIPEGQANAMKANLGITWLSSQRGGITRLLPSSTKLHVQMSVILRTT